MTRLNDDIETVLEELERADVAASDPVMESLVREDILRSFLQRCAEPIAALLNELKLYRTQSSGAVIPTNTHRVMVEGFSDKTPEQALAAALGKVGQYFSEFQDTSITLQQLIELPDGGHRATLEVHITPFTLRPKPHVQPIELEQKRQHQADFDKFRVDEATYKKHLVFDHFAATRGGISAGRIPEFLMINVNDANLMNYMLEKQFFKAGHNLYNSPAPKGFAVIMTPELHVPAPKAEDA